MIPFNPVSSNSYTLKDEGHLSLVIYDVLGQSHDTSERHTDCRTILDLLQHDSTAEQSVYCEHGGSSRPAEQVGAAGQVILLALAATMRYARSCPTLGLLALLLLHSPVEAQSFGPAAWIRQAWTEGNEYWPFIPMDIAVGSEDDVLMTGQLYWGEDVWFEVSVSESQMLDNAPNQGFLVRYDGKQGDLTFMRPGSFLPREEPRCSSIYSAGYSVDLVGGRLFHAEGSGLQSPRTSGSAMVTVRDLSGSVQYRFGPRARDPCWPSIFMQGIGFDAQGNLYMAGTYNDTLYFSPDIILSPSRPLHHPTSQVFVASYAPDGKVRWAQQIESCPDCLHVSIGRYGRAAVGVDATGNMVLGAVAYKEPPSEFSATEDGTVLAYYSNDGSLQKMRTLEDLGISYRPSFNELQNYPDPQTYVPRLVSIRHEKSGDMYMLWSKDSYSLRNSSVILSDTTFHSRQERTLFFLTKFDLHGSLLWARNLDYDVRLSPSGMEVTDAGHVYVFGAFRGRYLKLESIELTQETEHEDDGFAAHFDENGRLLRVLHAAGTGDQSVEAVAFGASDEVYVAGRFVADMAVLGADTLHGRGKHNVFIAKYRTTSLSYEVPQKILSRQIHASNYPNPFRGVTTITYNIPTPVRVRLSIYDVLGRQLAVLVDKWQGAGAHSARLDASVWPSGVYLYCLEADNQVATGRLVRRK